MAEQSEKESAEHNKLQKIHDPTANQKFKRNIKQASKRPTERHNKNWQQTEFIITKKKKTKLNQTREHIKKRRNFFDCNIASLSWN